MKKYKIVKFTICGETRYKLQERHFLFFWEDLGVIDPVTFRISPVNFYTREEAKGALMDWLERKNEKLIYYYG